MRKALLGLLWMGACAPIPPEPAVATATAIVTIQPAPTPVFIPSVIPPTVPLAGIQKAILADRQRQWRLDNCLGFIPGDAPECSYREPYPQ